jgi:hypothetical protein
MSYTAHHRSPHDACSLRARGSRAWASRDPQAAASGQAAISAHTPDRHHAAYLPEPGEPGIDPPEIRLALAPATVLPCPTSPPSPTAARSGGRVTTGSARTTAVEGPVSARTRHGARISVPGQRRAGGKEKGGVSVAVPEPSPPDPWAHRDGLWGQRLSSGNRCR